MKIVFFDGYCSLCNGAVDWMIRHDLNGELKFASLQGKTAVERLPENLRTDIDTLVYIRDNETFVRSTAILRAVADMGGAWVLVNLLLPTPESVRDRAYRFVARNRYRIFGKRQTCRLPTPEEKARLLD